MLLRRPPNGRTWVLLLGLTLGLIVSSGCGPSGENTSTSNASALVHVQATHGLLCLANGSKLNVGLGAPGTTIITKNLVLTRDPATYDWGSIQQIDSYVSALATNAAPSAPPPGVGWVSAATDGTALGSGCAVELEITNTTNVPITVTRVQARLLANPVPTSAHFTLLDLCSLPSTRSLAQCTFVSSAGSCSVALVALFLRQAQAGTVASTPVALTAPPGQTCAPLAPGDTLDIALTLTSIGAPTNWSYRVTPELELEVGGSQVLIPLQRLTTTLVFADPGQFQCVRLQGQTFVPTSTLTTGCA